MTTRFGAPPIPGTPAQFAQFRRDLGLLTARQHVRKHTPQWLLKVNQAFRLSVSASASRPAPSQSVRYVHENAGGTGNGTTMAISGTSGAWTLAQLDAALATTPNLYVMMMGNFEPDSYSTAGPLLTVVSPWTTLDFHTHRATIRGYSGLSWVASGTNGEYYASVGNAQARFRISEDGKRMRGLCALDTDGYAARLPITASSASANSVTYTALRIPAVNDKIAFVSAAAGGLTPGTLYYIKAVTGNSGSDYTVTLSTTQGGAAVDITSDSALTGKYLWTLANGRYGDPIPGSLAFGEFAYVPWEGRVYIKPTSGVVSRHVYTWWQGTGLTLLQIGGAEEAYASTIVGGLFYGAETCIRAGTSGSLRSSALKVIGTTCSGASNGILLGEGSYQSAVFNQIISMSGIGIGCAATSEASGKELVISNNHIHHLDGVWDSGDCVGIDVQGASSSARVCGNVVEDLGVARDLSENPIPLGGTRNIYGIRVRSFGNVLVNGNYLRDVYGQDVYVSGPSAATKVIVTGNVFDSRGVIAYDGFAGGPVTKQVLSVVAEASGALSTEVEFHQNSILAGDVDTPSGGSQDAALINLRCEKADLSATLKLSGRNNLFIFTEPASVAAVYSLRTNGTGATMLSNISGDLDYNLFFADEGASAAGALVQDNLTGQSPTATTALAALSSGWSLNGTTCDANSHKMTLLEFSDAYSPHVLTPQRGTIAFSGADPNPPPASRSFVGSIVYGDPRVGSY